MWAEGKTGLLLRRQPVPHCVDPVEERAQRADVCAQLFPEVRRLAGGCCLRAGRGPRAVGAKRVVGALWLGSLLYASARRRGPPFRRGNLPDKGRAIRRRPPTRRATRRAWPDLTLTLALRTRPTARPHGTNGPPAMRNSARVRTRASTGSTGSTARARAGRRNEGARAPPARARRRTSP